MSQQVEKSFGNLTIRTCHSVGDYRQIVDLQREVWHFPEAELIPSRLFVVGEKIGGHVIGAFDGSKAVGFAFGIPGFRGGHSYIHSHMLAVRPEFRNAGLGRELKLFQRELVLKQGLDLIEWTFDPLEIKNAHLNIEKLGAITRRYSVNQYGITSSPLQGGLPSDRLTAEWWIKSRRVEGIIAGMRPSQFNVAKEIEVPAEIYELKADPSTRAKAAQIQNRNREQFIAAFRDGLSVLGFAKDGEGNGRFQLGHWDEDLLYIEKN